MRGKPVLPCESRAERRIIPAHAGQTSQQSEPNVSSTDHPRACGANVLRSEILNVSTGSSPRMRGKRGARSVMSRARRIIPAHAGQTFGSQSSIGTIPDHPRACGANGVWGTFNIRGHGSSPRMRGKLPRDFHTVSVCRIIPAHAGQTGSSSAMQVFYSDHPRACGANPKRTRGM